MFTQLVQFTKTVISYYHKHAGRRLICRIHSMTVQGCGPIAKSKFGAGLACSPCGYFGRHCICARGNKNHTWKL